MYNLQGLLQSPEGIALRILLVFSPKINGFLLLRWEGKSWQFNFGRPPQALGLSRVEVWALGTLGLSCSPSRLFGALRRSGDLCCWGAGFTRGPYVFGCRFVFAVETCDLGEMVEILNSNPNAL